MSDRRLLLLDLDGVLVFERQGSRAGSLEILRLHQDLPLHLSRVGLPIIVLTHRSRSEALRILRSVGVEPERLLGVMAAEQLALSAVRSGEWTSIPRHGLRKRLILPHIGRAYGFQPEAIALLDDRIENLEDMLAAGLGLALHAPSALEESGELVSFCFEDALTSLAAWGFDGASEKLITLPPTRASIQDWQLTGMSTAREGRHAFNHARSLFRSIRQRRPT